MLGPVFQSAYNLKTLSNMLLKNLLGCLFIDSIDLVLESLHDSRLGLAHFIVISHRRGYLRSSGGCSSPSLLGHQIRDRSVASLHLQLRPHSRCRVDCVRGSPSSSTGSFSEVGVFCEQDWVRSGWWSSAPRHASSDTLNHACRRSWLFCLPGLGADEKLREGGKTGDQQIDIGFHRPPEDEGYRIDSALIEASRVKDGDAYNAHNHGDDGERKQANQRCLLLPPDFEIPDHADRNGQNHEISYDAEGCENGRDDEGFSDEPTAVAVVILIYKVVQVTLVLNNRHGEDEDDCASDYAAPPVYSLSPRFGITVESLEEEQEGELDNEDAEEDEQLHGQHAIHPLSDILERRREWLFPRSPPNDGIHIPPLCCPHHRVYKDYKPSKNNQDVVPEELAERPPSCHEPDAQGDEVDSRQSPDDAVEGLPGDESLPIATLGYSGFRHGDKTARLRR